MQSLPAPTNEIEFCYLLGLRSLPTFGVYSLSYDYDVLWPEKLSKIDMPIDKIVECPYLPLSMKTSLRQLSQNKARSFDVFTVEYDGQPVIGRRVDRDTHKRIRLNLVSHPLLFREKFDETEIKVYPKGSLYFHQEDSYLYEYCHWEKEPLKLNKENIQNEVFEVYFHKDENNGRRMSPNNSAAIFTTAEPINTFGLILLSEDGTRVWVYWNTVIWKRGSKVYANAYDWKEDDMNMYIDNKKMIDLVRKRSSAFIEASKEMKIHIEDLFKLMNNALLYENKMEFLNQIISNFFNKVFRVDNRFNTEPFNLFIKSYFDTKIDNIYIKLIKDASLDLVKELLLLYTQNLSQRLLVSLLTHCYLIGEESENIEMLEGLRKTMEKKSKDASQIKEEIDLNHILILFQNGFQYEAFDQFRSMNEAIKNLVYEETWHYKGRICGVSDNFGLYSFHGLKIDSKYHCNNEDMIAILTRVIKKLFKR